MNGCSEHMGGLVSSSLLLLSIPSVPPINNPSSLRQSPWNRMSRRRRKKSKKKKNSSNSAAGFSLKMEYYGKRGMFPDLGLNLRVQMWLRCRWSRKLLAAPTVFQHDEIALFKTFLSVMSQLEKLKMFHSVTVTGLNTAVLKPQPSRRKG